MDVESYRVANVQLAPAACRAGEPTWRSTCEPSSGKNRSCRPYAMRAMTLATLLVESITPSHSTDPTTADHQRDTSHVFQGRCPRAPSHNRASAATTARSSGNQPTTPRLAQESQLPSGAQTPPANRYAPRGSLTGDARQPDCVFHHERPKKKSPVARALLSPIDDPALQLGFFDLDLVALAHFLDVSLRSVVSVDLAQLLAQHRLLLGRHLL
ncbi:hypothetical protein FICKIIDM_03231 [Xanthomonas citri pv. punicae]|nr:hypothetical protein FICKIIDM_03231 [Xanthomonas citri pv. punicae]